MRLLLLISTLIFVFSINLSAQNFTQGAELYVWAKSGLVLRDSEGFEGEKITVIPYGTKIQSGGFLTYNQAFEVEAIPERVFDNVTVPAWKMKGDFVRVSYDGTKGYAYSGYLSYYNPAYFELDTIDYAQWLVAKPIDTLFSYDLEQDAEFGESSILYENGISFYSYWDKSGGGGTITVPNATLAHGYLIAEKLFDLGRYEPELGHGSSPTIIERTENSITFEFEQTRITITEIGGTIIIVHDSHC